jgi:hypothetical protein
MFCQKWLLRTIMMGWAASFAGAAAAADTVVRQFSIGTTSTTVGIAAAGEDVELTGPQALTSDVQGNLFVLDQINGRILKFNPKQPASDPSILKMPADVQANDLVIRKSDILVWDGSIRTLKAANEQSTRGLDDGVVQLEEVLTRDVDDQFAVSAFAQMGSQHRKAEVMESSTGGCNGRVCRNVYPLASLLERGYVPVRFRALAEDEMTVSASAYQESDSPTGRSKRPGTVKR